MCHLFQNDYWYYNHNYKLTINCLICAFQFMTLKTSWHTKPLACHDMTNIGAINSKHTKI